ncbi:T9SS type A sorting domain-containing protein [bacterium]|nr:T9SS type A sorting domain-containing protein [bacterium]
MNKIGPLSIVCLLGILVFSNTVLFAHTGNELNIPRSAVSVTVDGVKEAAWSSAETIQMDAYLNAEGVSHSWDTNDISASFQILWKDSFLYLFVTIRDDFNRAHSSSWWLSDAIELYLDAGHEMSGSYDYNDIHVGFVRSDASVHIPTGGGSFRDSWYINNVQFVPVNTGTGWTAEIGLELVQLRIPTVEGYRFGFDLQVNDNDSGTRDHMLKWYSSSNDSWKNPSLFGVARLGAMATDPVQGNGVHGTVTFSDGTPVSSVQVELVNVDNVSEIYGSMTNSSGYYSISMPQTGVRDNGRRRPEGFSLGQNYPNPFNPSTVIRYGIPASGPVRMEVFDILGRKVRTILNGYENEGMGQAVWDGTDDRGNAVPAGVYLYSLIAGDAVQTRKMVLLDGSKGGRFTAGGVPQWTSENGPLGKVNAGNYRIIVYGAGIVTYERFLGQITGDMTVDIVVQRSGSGGSSCTVSQPWQPSGPDQGSVGEEICFSTGGSSCSQGHPVQYRFDWGDGSGYSPWGLERQCHTYRSSGQYEVIGQGRCAVHSGIIQDSRRITINILSSSNTVTITIKMSTWFELLSLYVDGIFAKLNDMEEAVFEWHPGEIHHVHVTEEVNMTGEHDIYAHKFSHWSDENISNDRDIVVPFINTTYTAFYDTYYWCGIKYITSPSCGSAQMTPQGNPNYYGLTKVGTILTFIATPTPGHTFEYWSRETHDWGTINYEHLYSNPITFTFEGPNTYMIPVFTPPM